MLRALTRRHILVFAVAVALVAALPFLRRSSHASAATWPGPGNAGVPGGTALRTVPANNWYVVNTPGTVLDGIDLTGCVIVQASNVTVRNSRINCPADISAIWVQSGTGTLVDHNTISSTGGSAAAVTGSNMTIRGNDISNTADGIKVGPNVVVEGNWVHDLWAGQTSSGPTHNDGLQMEEGTNVVIRNNTFDYQGATANAGVFLKSDGGPISNVTIQNNLLSGFGFTVSCMYDVNGCNVIGNTFKKGTARFGPIVMTNGANGAVQCNVWSDGSPLAENNRPCSSQPAPTTAPPTTAPTTTAPSTTQPTPTTAPTTTVATPTTVGVTTTTVGLPPATVPNGAALTLGGLKASADDGNKPANVGDNNLNTRWSAFGKGQWVQGDVASRSRIDSVAVAFYRGDQRTADLGVQLSDDGANFREVLRVRSSGATTQQQRFTLPNGSTGRFVRLVGYGNSENDWASFTEVDVFGAAADLPTTTVAPTTTAPTTTGLPPATVPTSPTPNFPDASTTGVPAGARLAPSGSIVVTRPGTVLDSLEINGCVTVVANDVRITRSRITCAGGAAAVSQTGGSSGLVIEDSELAGAPTNRAFAGVWSDHAYTIRRSEVWGVGDGLFVGSGTVVEGNWIHGLNQQPGDHNDLIQMVGGNGVRIRNNRLEHVHNQTSAVFLKSDLAPIDDVIVENNLLAGGAYTLYVYAGNALFGGCCGAPTHVIVRNNTIKAGSYMFGPLVAMGSNTVACNRLDNGELAIVVDTDRGTNPHRNAC